MSSLGVRNPEIFADAVAAQRNRDLPAALRHYRRFIELNPAVPVAYMNMGMALLELGDLGEARRVFEILVANASDPQVRAQAHGHLAWIHTVDDALDPAVEHGRKAVALDPRSDGAWLNLAGVLLRACHYREVIACCLEAQRIGSNRFHDTLYTAKSFICDWDGLADIVAKLTRPEGQEPDFFLLAATAADPAAQLVAARAASCRYPQDYIHPVGAKPATTARKIRLGYFGNEFHDSPTMRCLVATLEHHDRARFEVHALSFGRSDDTPFGTRVRLAADHFHDLRNRSTEDIVGFVARHEIDILFDLCGYLKGHRMDVLARRPAPIQIGYVGWPATSGAPFIDHIVADAIVAPDQAHFSERLIHLDCYLPFDDGRSPPAIPQRQALGLPEDAIVLAAMNTSWKISRDMMAVWCGVLAEEPDSVLWIATRSEDEWRNLHGFAAGRGVGERLVPFPASSPTEFIDRVAAADLGLDTHPYNGHSTTADLLWAGVPVVTCHGAAFSSRVAASLIEAAGLGELSVGTLTDYRSLVLALCRDRARLAALKARLVAERRTSRLFDNTAYTRALEAKLVSLAA